MPEPCPFIPAELDNLVGMLDPANTDSDEPHYAEDFRSPAPCSFLRVGQTFSGQQRAAHTSFSQEQWSVSVRIQARTADTSDDMRLHTCTGL